MSSNDIDIFVLPYRNKSTKSVKSFTISLLIIVNNNKIYFKVLAVKM